MLDEELKYFKLAKELNNQFHDNLVENRMHFRGSIGSFSLISVSSEKPELGVRCKESKYISKDLRKASLMEDIDKINNKPMPFPSLSKPEKELQAWIINSAINNNYELPFDKNISFISSEIAVKNNAGKKIVTDILGYNEMHNQLCIIELKYERQEKRLIEQVNNFENVINERPEFFTELLSIHGFKNKNRIPQTVAKFVVWPYGKTSPKANLKNENIIEITYQSNYSFTVFK